MDPVPHPTLLTRFLLSEVKDYAILLLDPHNRITGWNVGARLICGYTEDEARGQSGSIIFVPEDRARGAVEHELDTALKDGRAEDERWHLRKDGSRFWGSGVMTPLRDETGHLAGFAKVFRDRTQRKQHEEALKAANQSLEQHVADRTAALVAYQQQLRALVLEHARAEQRQRRDLATELHDHLVRTSPSAASRPPSSNSPTCPPRASPTKPRSSSATSKGHSATPAP